MAKRVFELARELGVTSKQVLAKCRAEGLEIKNHMSTILVGLQATIEEWFSEEGGAHTAVETTEHVDLDKVRAEARKLRRRSKKEAAAAEAEVAVAEVPEEAVAVEPVEVPAEVFEAEAPPAEQPPAVAAEVAEGAAVAEAVAPLAEIEEPVAAEAAVAGAEPAPPAESEPVEVRPEEAEPPEVQKTGVVPAGPQVVPRPASLKGPRVVRVERLDFVEAPRRRRPAPAASADPVEATAAPPSKKGRPQDREGGAQTDKKGRRRSPRRRGGGRSADSGEKLKEWRNQDLVERSQRLAAASGGGLRRRRASVSRKGGEYHSGIVTGKIEIQEPITIKSLSAATGIKGGQIIKKLLSMGVMVTINQVIDRETAEMAVMDQDFELVVKVAKSAEDEMLEKLDSRERGQTRPRAPVVTFLGHVDHGKTSLLDRIRHTAVADGEAGGITQHIGAYRYDVGGQQVVFLDTPGHEAFTAMRARGANMTDVVVLVVAADDGVMPQTVEAISHARAAEVPIVVALNKIDVPNANVQRAMGQLAEHGLQSRQWGGDTEVIQTSAVTGEGIDTLVETLGLEAELLELAAEWDAPASGYVIEAEMDPGRGAVARLLVLNGTLHVADVLVAGSGTGRVRQMIGHDGRAVESAGPATPVEVSGLDDVPAAGDRFVVAQSIDVARSVAEDRRDRVRTKSLATGQRVTLENLFSQIEEGMINEVPLIIKADVQGSVEALTGTLVKLSTDEVRVNILHAAVGGISTGDVTLAEASNAIVIGFNVVPDSKARQLADDKGVDIRLYRVIYDITEDIRTVLEEGLAPEIREETIGHADVRQVFKISRLGTIAGCYVTDGLAARSAKVRLIRDNIVIEDNRTLDSLKRFKDDAREVRSGMECGLKLAGYDDIKEGDRLEFYKMVEVARKL